MELCRCTICNKVSTPELALENNQFTPRHFVPDPNMNQGHICGECEDVIYEQRIDYYFMDLDNAKDTTN